MAEELSVQQRKDAKYAEIGGRMMQDESVPAVLKHLAEDARVTVRRGGAPKRDGQCVVYWMQRAQRGTDNHALDKAVALGNALGLPVVAYFAAINNFVHANERHYRFLNQGLPDAEEDCAARNVTFIMRRFPHESHERFIDEVEPAMVVGDENPMRGPEAWRVERAKQLEQRAVPYWTIDADVTVPSKLLEKAQYAAVFARPRLYKRLGDFVVPYENLRADHTWQRPKNFLADDVRADITEGWPEFDRSVRPVEAWTGGRNAAMHRLKWFVEHGLRDYDTARNKPDIDGSSKMSPWLHFGHINPVTILLAVEGAVAKDNSLQAARDSYVNELVAWRELAVNFVRYQHEYDSPACADKWARETLAEHDGDAREVTYSRDQLERGETYDELWNAAQLQMVRYGWMHNYLRMYWAKKIVEWTPNVATAMQHAIWLNDRYELDGRDPNGYAGVAWSMLGKFDRAWFDRPIFGKRRYMSGASTGKKFNSRAYIQQVKTLGE